MKLGAFVTAGAIERDPELQAGYYRRMSDELFVPDDFAVPGGLMAGEFRLAPLGPQHNEADYAAWMASIDHIRATRVP